MIFSHQLVSCIQCKRIFLHHIICWTLQQLRIHSVLKVPRCKIHNCCTRILCSLSLTLPCSDWDPLSQYQLIWTLWISEKIMISLLMYKIKAMKLNEMGTLDCYIAFWQGSATTSWRFLLLITYCSQYECAWAMLFINTSVAFFHKFFKWSQCKPW